MVGGEEKGSPENGDGKEGGPCDWDVKVTPSINRVVYLRVYQKIKLFESN